MKQAIYFIAFKVQPSLEINNVLSKLRRYSGEITRPDMLHLTLLFLGEKCDIKQAKRAIDALKEKPVEAEFVRLASIKDARYKSAIAMIDKKNRTRKIHEQLKNSLANASIFGQYLSHITLLRTNEEINLFPISPIKPTLSKIVLLKAEETDGTIVYEELYTKYLDKFEDTAYKIVKSLDCLKEIEGIDAAVLYGSTAAGIIKQPIHDIDLYLLSKKPVLAIRTIKYTKKELQKIAKKYSTTKLKVKFWAVGLGKVFELHKVKTKKGNIGIEVYFMPRLSENDLDFVEIKGRHLKVLFGDISFLKRNVEYPYNAVEMGMSRYLATLLERGAVNINEHFNNLMFCYLQDKRILASSKAEGLQIIKERFPDVAGQDLGLFYKCLNGIDAGTGKSALIEYPEFVLKGKRNFVLFEDINNPSHKRKNIDYFRHDYHQPNLLFMCTKPRAIRDIFVYPAQQKDFDKNCPVLAKLIGREINIQKRDLLFFKPFSIHAAHITLKPLYINFDIKKDKFIFWYASLATIFQTAFSYLLTKGIFETTPVGIASRMQRRGFEDFNWKFVLDKISSQKVEDVQKLYALACGFIDKLAIKVLAGD